ncbi:MAG: CAP domain-containing protein [Candidatus Moraniibacteriota bacterium]
MTKRIFQLLFLAVLGGLSYFLVDFEDFALKTVDPKPKTEIQSLESSNEGVQRENGDTVDFGEKTFDGTGEDIIQLVNEAREGNNLKPLEENTKLNASAMKKAQHMKKNDYFEHTSPEGLQPWYFAEKSGYQYKTFGENLAEGFFSAESAHKGWMDSQGHRENILSEKFKEIGVAILDFQQNGQKSYMLVQHFGRPMGEEDLKNKTVCEEESRKNCEEAEKREGELDDLIEEQEDAMEDAKDKGVKEEDLEEAIESLEKLEEKKEELEDYLDECEDFIEDCDEWR